MNTMTVHDVQQGTPAAKPELTADEFAASLPKWKKLIDDRKQTASQIITMVSTRNTLTEDQQASIRKIEAESTGE
jgi:hypothetical protein